MENSIGDHKNNRKTCRRCAGTGWWAPGRVCFACGGFGSVERDTLAVRIRNKRAHLDEVSGIVAEMAARSPRFGKAQHERQLAERRAQLPQLEAELAALESRAGAS